MFLKRIRLVAAMLVALCLCGGGAGMLVPEAGTPSPAAAAASATALVTVNLPDQEAKLDQAVAPANPELVAAWDDLASDDEPKALKAVLALAGTPKETALFLKDRLKPVTFDPKRIARLIADLDSDKFSVREQASHELVAMGDYAVPYLHSALDGKPALEPRLRLEKILETAKAAVPPPSVTRSLRAIAVLEKIGTPEARHILEALARGRSRALATQEAEAALDRLTEPPVITLQRHVEDLVSKDAAKVARAVLALAATPKQTVQFLSTAPETKPTPAPNNPNDKRYFTKLKALEEKRLAYDYALLGKNPNQPAPAMASSPSKEAVTKRIGVLLEHIGTQEARQLWEAIQQGKLIPGVLQLGPRGGKSALSPDGKLKAVLEDDITMSLFDVATGKQLRLVRTELECTSIFFSEDGKRLAAEGRDGQRLLWDVATGKLISREGPNAK